MTCVEVHLNGELKKKIASGRRLMFVVGTPGRKWITLLYPADLTLVKVSLKQYEMIVVRELSKKEARRAWRMMKRTVKTYKELGLKYSKNAVKEINKEYT